MHGIHACVAAEQNGVGTEQSVLVRQPTHTPPAATSHTGRVPGQAAVLPVVHSPQAPLAWHTGVAPPQSVLPAQPTQVLLPAAHTGVVPAQSLPVKQPTQRSLAVSQSAFGAAHAPMLPAVHSWQAPLGTHTGVADAQSAAPAQARQVRVPLSQVGLSPAQSLPVRQPTHTTLTVSHSGAVPGHALWLVAEQTPQEPFGWQAGAAPPH